MRAMMPEPRRSMTRYPAPVLRPRRLVALAAALVAFGGLGLIGFNDSRAEGAGEIDAEFAPDPVPVPGVAARFAPPPTIEELTKALDLTSEEAEDLTPSLNRWRAAHESRSARFAERRSRERGERWVGQGPHGPAGAGRLGPRDGEPPMMSFLADAADALDPDQMVALAELLAERRGAPGKIDRPGRGRRWRGRGAGHCPAGPRGAAFNDPDEGRVRPGGPSPWPGAGPTASEQRTGGAMRDLMDELDLSRGERREVRNALREYSEEFHELAAELSSGDLDAQTARERAREQRLSLERELKETLGADDYAKARKVLSTQRASRAQQQLERIEEHHERRSEYLGRVLKLTGQQKAQVSSALAEARSRREALISRLRDGSAEQEDVMVESWQVRQATHDAIRRTLTGEQAAVWDAMQKLLPGGGPGARGF